MTDNKLLRTAVALEKPLQLLMEQNLETLESLSSIKGPSFGETPVFASEDPQLS